MTNCWSLSERTGDLTHDLVRGGTNYITFNNGGAGATPIWVTGQEDAGLFGIQFDGTNGASNRAVTGVPDPSTPHSMSIWFYMGTTGSKRTICGYGNDSSNLGHNCVLLATREPAIVRVSTGATIVSAETTAAAYWSHIVYTYDGTTNRLYHQGFEIANSTTAVQGATVNAVTIGENVHTGFPERAGSGQKASDLRFWNRPLTPAEVFAMWNRVSRFLPYYPRPLSLGTGGAVTFSGSGAVTISNATCSGSATFAAGTKTASGAVTISNATASGVALFAPGDKVATGAVTVSNITAEGAATFSPGTKTATGAVSASRATCAGVATSSVPTYTGAGAVSATKATAQGSATFTAPTYTGVGVATVSNALAAGVATRTAPTYTGAGAVTVSRVLASGEVVTVLASGFARITDVRSRSPDIRATGKTATITADAKAPRVNARAR